MSELRHTVDHLRLNYDGPFDAKALHKIMTSFWKEKGFDFETRKESEHDTQTGKHMEWHLKPWKQIAHETRDIVKMRVIINNYNKIDAIINDKKVKIGNGKVVIYLDGYLELDQWNVWERVPFFQFLRSIYTHFVYRVYTERFEQRLTYDVNHLYHNLEQFFNMYKHYKVVSKVAPFASA